MECPVCLRNMVVISLSLADGPLTLHACSRCETRWWDDGRTMVGRNRLLASVAATR